MAGEIKRRKWRLVHLLLLAPFIGILWVPFYNHTGPELAGIPFFYWYQLLWIPLGALALLPIYLVEERDAARGDGP